MAAQPSYHTSLLTATDSRGHVHLIIGSNSLAGKRCEQSLATGARPILVAPDPDAQQQQQQSAAAVPLHYGLAKAIESGQVTWLRQPFTEDLLFSLGREEVGGVVDAVFITSMNHLELFRTPSPLTPSTEAGAQGQTNHDITKATTTTVSPAQEVSALCKRNRIPINVVDSAHLSSFTILSTHTDGPLQIGVTTNGRGCHLASRIRREVAASLPVGLGAGCARLGEVRRRVQEEDQLLHEALATSGSGGSGGGDEEGLDQSANFNQLITEEDLNAAKSRRMRWLSQVCEYWPLKRLAGISDEDVDIVLQSYPGTASSSVIASIGRGDDDDSTSNTNTSGNKRRGRIILAGSGPGHPDLLTRATYKAIQSADLILADKLVPSGVLDLIPRRTPVSIARKFPGNADQAQEELLQQALAGVQQGKSVLRLKQGDPFIYGRGGEEVEYFRARGYVGQDQVIVLPGITSALSAPLFAGVPPTQRDVADQVLICTGTGKKGKAPAPPEYVASRTCVFLMGLHRIGGLVAELTTYLPSELGEEEPSTTPQNGEEQNVAQQQRKQPTRPLWPLTTPCAVIERASCPDQRVVRTTLQYVAEAIEQEGSRPPGLLVVGRACEALYKPAEAKEGREGGAGGSAQAWTVEEGFRGLDVEDAGVNAALSGLAALG